MKDMSKKTQNVNTSEKCVHKSDKSVHEPWNTSDMAHRSGGLSVEQEPVDIHCPSCLHSFSIVPVAKRQWVSLTEEESSDIYNAHHNTYGECITSAHDLVLDIEAKLREKNT